jgi:hypothetical protein
MTRWLVLGAILEALVLAGLALHFPGAENVGSEQLADIFVAVMGIAGLVYFAAVALVLRGPPPPGAVVWVLAVALIMRLTVLFAPPFLSSDMYRYVWDGKVQAAGINPYRYIPDDPALAALRDGSIYPHVNRHEYAPTIYPPMAQIIFAAVARVSPTVTAMKAVMVGFEIIAILAMLRLLDLAALPRSRVLIYAWNPLAVWSFAGNGHADAAVVGFVALALLARAARRDTLTGIALAGAILIKFLPVVIAPALWRRWNWRIPLACVATIIALYLCYISVGARVLGFLPAYGAEEGLAQGSGIWLLAGLENLTALPTSASLVYFALVAAVFAWLALTMSTGSDSIQRTSGNAAILAAGATAAISAHYPWYFVWLALPSCITPYRSIIFLSAAAMLLYRNPLDERFFWPCLLYIPAIVLAVFDLRRHVAVRAVTATSALERTV